LKYNGAVISSFTDSTASGTSLACTANAAPVPDCTGSGAPAGTSGVTVVFGDTTVTGSTAMNGGVGQVVIKAGTTGAFEVDADVKAMATGGPSASAFDAGDTLKVSFPSATLQSTAVAVQDQTGSSLGTTSTNRTGSASGYNATFRVQGVTASYVGNTFTPTKNTSGVLTSEAYTTTLTVAAVGNDFFVNPVANHITGSGSTTANNTVDTSVGFNVEILNSSNVYQPFGTLPTANVSLSVTCTSGCIQQSLTSMKIPSGTTATFVVTTTLTDTSIPAGGYKVAIYATNATDGTTLSQFLNTPSYNFITPVSPDSFQ